MKHSWRGWNLTPVEYALYGETDRIKTCKVCGEPFVVTRRAGVYCSDKCNNLASQRMYLNRKKSIC